jgi:hypothetical protein
MIIKNNKYNKLKENDLLICAIGYESRSWFLLEQNFATRNDKNTLVFFFEKHEQAYNIFYEIKNKQIKIVDSKYNDIDNIKDNIIKFVNNSPKEHEMNIHIDYSSMPRTWYCSFPFMSNDLVKDEKPVSFWYVSGNYPEKYSSFPSAGIDSISVFSGLSLPAIDIKRFHIIGLSYDNIRTETMVSIIEPESLISCYAYNPRDRETKKSVCEANKNIIIRSLFSAALPIDNFRGIVDKLCELVFDLTQNGQVIFVPDGPKPLIMAMSLMPDIIEKNGITCLHILRNNTCFSKIDVKPREDEIYGFQVLFKQ